MDTVSEEAMAIAMARNGGIAVLHKNQSAEKQMEMVHTVKRSTMSIIESPISICLSSTVDEARRRMDKHGINGLVVTADDDTDNVMGIVSRRDLRKRGDFVKDIMTREENLVRASKDASIDECRDAMAAHSIEKLILIDDGRLTGLRTMRDIRLLEQFPLANRDAGGRLRVAAAIGVSDADRDRAKALTLAHVDALVVDTAHGDSKNVFEMVRWCKENLQVDIVAGNISNHRAVKRLIECGVDGIKVGQGCGAVCSTRPVTGIGVPQFTAVQSCSEALDKQTEPEGPTCTLIADGGIRYSGDVAKAIAAGADCVMLGSMLAGTDEAPGADILHQGMRYKSYRGMGSMGAMDVARYNQAGSKKFVPEGVEARVPAKGPVAEQLAMICGGMRGGMAYCGAADIETFQVTAEFIKVTQNGVKESHPHSVTITADAPNYKG